MVPIIPVAIVTLAGVSAWAIGRRDKFHGEMTTERVIVFESALEHVKEPEKLNRLADAFAKEGLKDQASLLRKRAKLKMLPEDIKEARREVFKKAMVSMNPAGIRTVANAFNKEGATGAARELQRRATALDTMLKAA